MSRTYPQIIMLSHASHVNAKRAGLLKNKKTSGGDERPESYKNPDVPMWHGKRIDELNSEQYQAYLNDT